MIDVAAEQATMMRPVEGGRFRQALSRHAGGVAVVTGPGPVGLTVTSFTSASLDPPLVSLYVARSSGTWSGLHQAPAFGVNVLAGDQADVAARFAEHGVDRFAKPTRWRPGPLDVPFLYGVVACLLCEPYRAITIGDHWLLIGLVTDAELGGASAPLLYHRSRFGRFHEPAP
jgi:flavin reductase (DIM6/NTAB) family NADH-FMN oxidoreductase RutF